MTKIISKHFTQTLFFSNLKHKSLTYFFIRSHMLGLRDKTFRRRMNKRKSSRKYQCLHFFILSPLINWMIYIINKKCDAKANFCIQNSLNKMKVQQDKCEVKKIFKSNFKKFLLFYIINDKRQFLKMTLFNHSIHLINDKAFQAGKIFQMITRRSSLQKRPKSSRRSDDYFWTIAK